MRDSSILIIKSNINSKSALQELVLCGTILPNYELIKKEGPDHNPFFIIKVKAMAIFLRKCETIKLAELNAAKNILKIIREKNININEISYSGLVSLVGAPNAGKSI